jgi:hypothetical protein
MADHLEPWERPGAVRRDCEPHRGQWLILLGIIGLLCGIALPPLGVALALLTQRLANADLARMDARLLDPAGRPATSSALQFGFAGVFVACVFLTGFLCLMSNRVPLLPL